MRAAARKGLWVVVVVAGWLGSAAADETDVGTHFNGSSIGGGVHLGPHVLQDGTLDARMGYGVGVYARFHTVMTVFSAQLEYGYAFNEVERGPHRATLHRHGPALSIRFHPLFLRLLTNNTFWYVLTSAYGEVGAGLDVSHTRVGEGRDRARATDVGASLHVGAGIEIPLDDPDDEGAFWLGLAWRWKFALGEEALPFVENLHAHFLTLGIGYRDNRTSFGRVDRPPELKWR